MNEKNGPDTPQATFDLSRFLITLWANLITLSPANSS